MPRPIDIKISVCIASYNQQEFLSDAIESCLSQTVRPHEIIICNDGSTDHSLAIAKSYESQGVKVIDQVNKGLASARNTLLMNATGDYIQFLDSDDMLMPNCIEKMLETIKETDADIVAPSFKQFGLANQEVILMENPNVKDFWVGNRIGYFSAVRRSKLLEIGGYSPRMAQGYEDYHIWFDLLKKGATIKTIQTPLVLYRVRENSMITTAQKHHEELMNQIKKDHMDTFPKKKIAFVMICLNPPYWQYIKPMIDSARKYFLPHHKTDFFLWSDVPEKPEDISVKLAQFHASRGEIQTSIIGNNMMNLLIPQDKLDYFNKVNNDIASLKKENITIFPIESVEWPLPTLMRYSLFLQQEEKLKEYDYIFYCDADMLWVDYAEEAILSTGLTAAQHPMYAFKPGLQFPLETNPESSAYIPVPKYYYAGGFQGGVASEFIKAMKVMKKRVDYDFTKNYVARWNDESHWNRYLAENPPSVVLNPSYIYPDSLINEYYAPIWGCNYKPILVTLTKPFSTSKEGGEAVRKNVAEFAALKNEPRNY